MSKQALRELRQAVRANRQAAAFLLSVLSTASEVVIRKPLAEMIQLPRPLPATAFDEGWMGGEIAKDDLAAALAVLLGAQTTPSRDAWMTLAGSGATDSLGRLLPIHTDHPFPAGTEIVADVRWFTELFVVKGCEVPRLGQALNTPLLPELRGLSPVPLGCLV